MRGLKLVAAVLLGAAAVPAHAQFEDLVRETERLGAQWRRPVTVDLRRVAAEESALELSEASGLDLRCDPRLARRKVTLIARETPIGDVTEALARGLRGRWCRQGRAFRVEPVEPAQALTPEEVTSELCARVLGLPLGASANRQSERDLLALLGPAEMEALKAEGGVPVRNLPTEMRQALAATLGWDIISALAILSDLLSDVRNADAATISLREGQSGEQLTIRLPSNPSLSFTLRSPTSPAPAKAPGEP